MAELRIELIAVGDELLMGQVLDTNSHWIARRLADEGMRLHGLIWSADSEEEILSNLAKAWNDSDVVIVMGGLGPTHDDLTRPTLAAFFGDELEFREDLAEHVRQRYTRRGSPPAPGWESMATFPISALPIPNEHGAAPGIHYQRDSKELFAVPGVPSEMRGMVDSYILPRLLLQRAGTYSYKIIRTSGSGESHLAALIGDVNQIEPVKLAFLPSLDHGVTLRLSLFGENQSESSSQLAQAEEFVANRISSFIYSRDNRSLDVLILEEMRRRGLKLAVAESCTGGMVCSRLVGVPGSSDVLDRGFVTYSNRAKEDTLGVRKESLEVFGAVSEQVAKEMASGARIAANADVGLSMTGIAGPGGGTADKPVGLVYVGISDTTGSIAVRHLFAGDRDENRRRSTLSALTLLFNRLIGR